MTLRLKQAIYFHLSEETGNFSVLHFVPCRSRGAQWVPTGPHLPADVRGERAPPVAVTVGTSCSQPFHQGSEGNLWRPHAAPLLGTGGPCGLGLWAPRESGEVTE